MMRLLLCNDVKQPTLDEMNLEDIKIYTKISDVLVYVIYDSWLTKND